MATLGDSLSSSIGKSWSTWGESINCKQSNDVDSNSDEKKPKVESDSMKLRNEDMALYGFCPAQDEFFLVVCERCGQVIKPQALQRHIELRHEQKSSKKSKSPGSSHIVSLESRTAKISPTKHGDSGLVFSHKDDQSTEKNRKNHNLPFVKVERISSGTLIKQTSLEPKYDKPKLSFKETYKEHKVVNESSSGDVTEQTESFLSEREEKPDLENNEITIKVKKEPVFEGSSSDYKEEPGGGMINSEFAVHESIFINNNTGINQVKIEQEDMKKELDYGPPMSHAQMVPECIEELTCTAEPPVPQMVEETACAVEAINSQELVDKLFGKIESQVDEIPTKSSGFLRKVQEEARHVIEIDNRSSTPILHIPSPKGGDAGGDHIVLVDSPKIVQAHTPQSLLISSGGGVASKPNSRPPSRTHSRPQSRQPSQPSTPLTKVDTIILDSYDVSAQLSRLSTLQESSSSIGGISSDKIAVVSIPDRSPAISPVITPQKTFFNSGGAPFKEKKCIPCKDRVYDAERHCGAWIADQGRHCTRSLTCKTHALSVRRAVQGRSKPFDQLLFEHRSAKEAEVLRKAKASAPLPVAHNTDSSVSRVHTATKTVTMTTTSTVVSNCRSKLVKTNSHQVSASAISKQPPSSILSYTHTPKPAVFPVLSRSRLLPLPVPMGGHVTSEGEEDEEGDSVGYPCLQHHPRPAAVNSWGSRQYGRGCYTFNQRCDLLRSAFSSLVDVHNQAPPHKKQCLDPKLTQLGPGKSCVSQDPYDFSFGDSNSNHVIQSTAATHVQQQYSSSSGNFMAKHKSKVPVNLLTKSVKLKTDGSSLDRSHHKTSSNHSHPSKSSSHHHKSSLSISGSTSKTNTVSSSLKRKRSGSSGVAHTIATSTTQPQVATVSMPAFSSPLSITIPAGINLATLNNATLNSSLKGAQTKNNLNIVVSNTPVASADQPNVGRFTNGQLLNIPSAGINLDMSQFSQLGSLTQVSAGNGVGNNKMATALHKVAAKGTAKLIPATTIQNRSMVNATQKAQPFQIGFGNGSSGPVMAALQTGTVVMDTSGQSPAGATFLAAAGGSSQVALPTATAITMSKNPAAHQSTPTSIVFKKDGHLANGVLPHSSSLHQKTLPLSINHHQLASTDPTNPNTAVTQLTFASKLQGRNSSLSGSKLSHLPKNMTATLKPAMATLKPASFAQTPLSRASQQIAATINLGQQGGTAMGPGRYITPGNLQQVYANQVLSPLHLQPKTVGTTGGAKAQTGTTTTKLLQPMSLTIVAPPGGLAGLGSSGQARPLLINSSDASNGKTQLTEVVSSPGSVT